jgi:hypothetical protein
LAAFMACSRPSLLSIDFTSTVAITDSISGVLEKTRDPRYAAQAMAQRSLNGGPPPRAANAKTYSTKATS